MSNWQRESAVSQLAAHLRGGLEQGRWVGRMPGVIKLADQLGVARNTVEGALRDLERQGILTTGGRGKGRMIRLTGGLNRNGIRVAILTFEPVAVSEGHTMQIQQRLTEAGHSAFFTAKSLAELGHSAEKVARFVTKAEADAWVVEAGSREVLEWFATRSIPVFALFGRRRALAIPGAGPDKIPAYAAATRRLLDLGHKRIVLLTGKTRRFPTPGDAENAFLAELAARGIATSNYHLPDWKETVQGFNDSLRNLFRFTPPSALIVDEPQFFLATLNFCANCGLRVPNDISLVSTDDNASFAWFQPEVAHIRWDRQPLVLRICQWVSNISQGKEDILQTFSKAEFVDGGTIGPAKKS